VVLLGGKDQFLLCDLFFFFFFLISYWNEVSIFKKEKEKYDDNNLKIMLLNYKRRISCIARVIG
jgi:hypothetical protein